MLLRSVVRFVSSNPVISSSRGAAKGVKVESVSADVLPYKGAPVDHKPVKVTLEAGKTYAWCSCGLSVTQPFCDNTHKLNGVTNVKPVKFQVEKSGDYRLCNCKQTATRPICDGSHKTVSKAPRNVDASRAVAFADSPVYDGVAHKLGYRPRNGGFQ